MGACVCGGCVCVYVCVAWLWDRWMVHLLPVDCSPAHSKRKCCPALGKWRALSFHHSPPPVDGHQVSTKRAMAQKWRAGGQVDGSEGRWDSTSECLSVYSRPPLASCRGNHRSPTLIAHLHPSIRGTPPRPLKTGTARTFLTRLPRTANRCPPSHQA